MTAAVGVAPGGEVTRALPFSDDVLKALKFRATRVRLRLARWVVGVVAREAPEVLEEHFRTRVSEVSQSVVMAVMDTQGIRHCHDCPQRVGLKKYAGALFCEPHAPKTNEAEEARDGGKRG